MVFGGISPFIVCVRDTGSIPVFKGKIAHVIFAPILSAPILSEPGD
jgi:hypothetical protein